jgi:hypothetical protein
MLLCLVKRSHDISLASFCGLVPVVVPGLGCWVADKTGRGRSGSCWAGCRRTLRRSWPRNERTTVPSRLAQRMGSSRGCARARP